MGGSCSRCCRNNDDSEPRSYSLQNASQQQPELVLCDKDDKIQTNIEPLTPSNSRQQSEVSVFDNVDITVTTGQAVQNTSQCSQQQSEDLQLNIDDEINRCINGDPITTTDQCSQQQYGVLQLNLDDKINTNGDPLTNTSQCSQQQSEVLQLNQDDEIKSNVDPLTNTSQCSQQQSEVLQLNIDDEINRCINGDPLTNTSQCSQQQSEESQFILDDDINTNGEPLTMAKQQTYAWTQAQIKLMVDQFELEDKTNEGLDSNQCAQIMKNKGLHGNAKTIQNILGTPDVNTKISKDSFKAALHQQPPHVLQEFAMMLEFKKLDKDNSGHLTREEITMVVKAVETSGQHEKSLELLVYVDAESKSNNNKISYEKFLYVHFIENCTPHLESIFRALDKDNSGYLTRDEILTSTRREPVLRLAKDIVSKLLEAWVMDKDNKIYYKEFLQAWCRLKEKPIIPTFCSY